MPGEKLSMRMTRGMSLPGVITMVIIMFLPVCLMAFAWRVLPDALQPIFGLGSVVWAFTFLIIIGAYRFITRKRRQFTLRLEDERLILAHGKRTFKEFDLRREHRLLIIIKEFTDRRTRFFERWAEVRISQGPERLSFRIYLRLGDAGKAPPPGEETGLACALEYRGAARGLWKSVPGLWSYEWEGHYVGETALKFLKALDSFSANNALLPAIEKARAGAMSISRLKRMMLQ